MLDASLLIIQGRDQGARVPLDEPAVRLGRGVDNDFRVMDSEVSRHHAVIKQTEAGGFRLEDLNSSNGSFVNGRQVSEAPLGSGDQVQLGRTVLLFESSSPESDRSLHAAGRIDLVSDVGSDHSRIVGSLDPRATLGTAANESGMMARLQTLYEVSELVTSPAKSIDDLLQRILNRALVAVAADRGCVLLADPRTDEIQPRVFASAIDGDGRSAAAPMPISTTIVQHVLSNGQGVHTSDARRDERFSPGQSILRVGIREAMCVPIQGRYELLGVLYVDTTGSGLSSALHPETAGRFSSESLKLLSAVGRQAALAVETNRYQTALVSAERLAAVGETVTTLAHDMKNILQGMKGGSYLIESGLKKDDPDTARRGLTIFGRNQDRLYDLASDMLTFSKDRRPDLRMCDINALVREIGELVTPIAEERRIAVTVEEGRLPASAADETALHRALLNLVTNALDAAGGAEGAAVSIRTRPSPDGDGTEIAVQDNGPGMAADEIDRIFNLFESSKKAGGTGIGLAVSRKIVREHGGSIDVDSAPGHGATFRVHLPILRASDEAAALATTGDGGGDGEQGGRTQQIHIGTLTAPEIDGLTDSQLLRLKEASDGGAESAR